MKTVLITGASGFVGSYLAKQWLSLGYHVIGLGTSAKHHIEHDNFTWISADTTIPGEWQDQVTEADIIINLAGRNIFKPWTKAYKQAIYDSRVKTTMNLVSAMGDKWEGKLLNASAVGFYGDRGETTLSETEPCGSDFLAHVCLDWENEAQSARDKGANVSILRFGVVLGQGGALEVMGRAFKMFAGGPMGSGNQWFPWIHIEDLNRAISFLIENNIEGTFNFSGPSPIRQKDFAKALGRALSRPAIMPAPAFMVKLVMGELGASLLQSQKALPTALEQADFRFLYATADQALNKIYDSES